VEESGGGRRREEEGGGENNMNYKLQLLQEEYNLFYEIFTL
jgi:hypothetical protein